MNPVTLHLQSSIPAAPVRHTARTAAVAAIFGLPLERTSRALFQPFSVMLPSGSITLITGPSGAGKSTILRSIESDLTTRAEWSRGSVVRLEEIPLSADVPVVDCFACSLEAALSHLTRAGLSEAHILLRAPAELSEGQRFRYRLAQFFASDSAVLIADEFAATLDRITARILAFQLRKFITAGAGLTNPKCAILATTHEDLVEDLSPDVMIYKGLGEELRVRHRVMAMHRGRGP